MKTKEEIEKLAEKYAFNRWGDETLEKEAKFSYSYGYTQCQNDMLKDQKVTRFEVIDENGRVYSSWNCKIELSYQDDDRTLKVFIKP